MDANKMENKLLQTKEKRGANFTKSEINTLVDIALNYKHIIENKRTDGTTSLEKNKAWDKIAEKFNSTTGNFARSTKTIRTKYDALKKDLRKKCSKLRNEQNKTGGGIPNCDELLSYEEKFLAVCKTSMIGLNSNFDDDANEPEVSPNLEMGTSCSAANEEIEYLKDDTEDVLAYLQGKSEIPILSVTINNETRSDSEITSASHKDTPQVTPKKRKAPVYNKYPFIKTNKTSRLNQNAKKLENEINTELVCLKKQLLKLQVELVEKETAQKEKIAAITIENLLLDQAIKKRQLEQMDLNSI